MHSGRRTWITLAAICLVLPFVGCDNKTPVENPDNGNDKPVVEKPNHGGNGNDANPQPSVPTIPKVEMTQTARDKCLVFVGDEMPEGKLPNIADNLNLHSLQDLYGQKLTVIFFWKSSDLYSVEEFGDLQGDVTTPYFDRGVSVIGINEGDSPEEVAALIQEKNAKFANVLDPNGEYFGKVATENTTRTYVLDADGKIIWLDTEYSTATRRGLKQTINAVLGETETETP